ncbi:NAD-dependent epimerase/dehydratase family protein [Pseudomonas sp. C11]|uniref:NAD-dependent epimerase/dehydratase family protein n=1 Tax=Pseudomonas sp. C11 TaxID=3075550 RepID=UPI002AFFD409|nr:NAD-dependent epimerase/dehydratase family protein [Pseudomonas sp. C11]
MGKTHIIVGASSVGIATAKLLVSQGEHVRLVSRKGSGPDLHGVEQVAADATDADQLTGLASNAEALYVCAAPPYDRWPQDWPLLASALLTTAERTGAVLVSHSNAYGYGPVTQPMTEQTPTAAQHPKLRIRADIWHQALALHEAGRIRATEVRASDHIQPNSVFALALCKPLLEGKKAVSPIPLDVPHSWTSVDDAARLLIAVATDERAWGKVWHAPTNPPLTARELVMRFCEVENLPTPRLSAIPYPLLWTLGLFMPMLREMRATRYQFAQPFILDSTASAQVFGLTPMPFEEALRDTARMLRTP